ncbi:putative aldolase class 2 protein RP493 [Antedon mediterranea]|uniref:putative aldolase class 2 protein RP493 n=1 Tax=Antedon mediterranea TaxID=105859 RepID=UPI003AF41BD0
MFNCISLNSRSFFPFVWDNLRMISTSTVGLCKQQQQQKYRPWLNIEQANKVKPSSSIEKNRQDREDLAAAYRGLAYYGLSEGVCNHLTSRTPAKNGEGEVMLIVKYGLHWTEVTASSLLGINIENGSVLEGDGEPETSAAEIHKALHSHILKTDPSIQSVFHTHPPHATSLACLEDPTLHMIHQNSTRFFEDVAYDCGYDGLATTGVEGPRIAQQLHGKSVMFMGNHGVLVLGKSTAEAFDKTYYLEKAAELQVLAMSTGKKMSKLPDNLAKFVNQQIKNDSRFLVAAHFESIKRILKHTYQGDFTS